jgi:hypothetical protein
VSFQRTFATPFLLLNDNETTLHFTAKPTEKAFLTLRFTPLM